MMVAFDVAASWMSSLVMPPTPRRTNASLTSSRSSLREALGQRLERAGHVGLDDEVERRRLARLDLLEDVLELGPAAHGVRIATETCLAEPVLTGRGHLGGGLLVGCDHEAVTGLRDLGQAEDLHRRRRPGFLDLLAPVVDEGADAAPGRTGHERVADPQRAPLHQHGGHRAPTDVEVGLEHDADGSTVEVAPQVLELGDDQQVLEQVVDAEVLQRRDLHHDRVAPPLLGLEAVLGELGHDPGRIGVLAVDLVDGDHDRHLGGPGVVECLEGLGHHAVVGGHHEHHDVGGLGATGPHGGERLVARGVDEGDRLARS